MERIVERFLRYCAIDTKSDESATQTPSSEGQLVLGRLLVDELNQMGAEGVYQDQHGYVYAHLSANTERAKKADKIAFLAHLDTSPALDGHCTHPQFVDYQGGDIRLNDTYSIRESEFPSLRNLVGKRLIVTDGTTLLGADDKAGVAAAMELLQWLLEHPEFEHGYVAIALCPDEEIGHGASLLDLERLGVDYAYTIDSGDVGEMEYETFNAASAHLHFQGKSVHPGTAKNIMLNACDLICRFNSFLPEAQKPQYTEGYEGFFMPETIEAGVDSGTISYIIRDHSREKFEAKKQLMTHAVDYFNEQYGPVITLTLKDSYYNMKDKLMDHMDIVTYLKEAMIDCGIEPIIQPVRGGTDGSQLSWRGLPCPNFFTGGENYHGRYELIPEEAPALACQVARRVLGKAVERLD